MVICWWSGGITSAVACKLAVDLFPKCRVIMIDTKNEHPDTYRFKNDCENWYKLPIETISAIPDQYESIQDVWRKHKSLNVANGAICSYKLKRVVREKWQRENEYGHQVFGFEFTTHEMKRAMSLSVNHPKAKPIFPLIMMGYDKEKCIQIVQSAGIEIPMMYRLGFKNNNCFNTGCVQGGVGYWQKIKKEFPDKFHEMAMLEWELSELRGEPVTMLRRNGGGVFLKKNLKFPDVKTIDEFEGRPVEPLVECNGFCGTNDMSQPNQTEEEINYQPDLFA